MAGHADTADVELDEGSIIDEAHIDGAAADAAEPQKPADEPPASDAPSRTSGRSVRSALVVASIAVVAVGGVGGWLTYGAYQEHQRQLAQDQFVAVARQAAVNLTTIDFMNADADVARILDGATGTFLDDFQKRAQPFIDVVKQVKSKSEGTVTEAGIESVEGDQAQVLVSLQVKTATEGNPEGGPQQWRMRIDVQKVADVLKVDNVQFVL